MPVLGEIFRSAESTQAYVKAYSDHFANVVRSMDTEAVAKFVDIVERVGREDKSIFFIANGGSAAVASHWVNDLGPNSVVEGQPGFRAIALTDNPYSITAVGNDASIQLKAAMRPGDVVVAMSVSGNSPNLVRGLEYAKENGAYTVACTGMTGGKLKEIADLAIHTESSTDEYGPIEDMFSVFMHIVTGFLTMKRGRHLHH